MTFAALAAAPAAGQPDRKTELVALGGASVDKLQLRYDIDAGWLVDNQNILYRDAHRDHYLVTLKNPCAQLDVRSRGFEFRFGDPWQLLASRAYEVRPDAGPHCSVARIEQVDDARADTLLDKAQRRLW
jgi:hypothetical protein